MARLLLVIDLAYIDGVSFNLFESTKLQPNRRRQCSTFSRLTLVPFFPVMIFGMSDTRIGFVCSDWI